jgi:hypothetical protein
MNVRVAQWKMGRKWHRWGYVFNGTTCRPVLVLYKGRKHA